jgi:pyruvate,water dikinase
MKIKFTKNFKQLSKNDVSIAGGKGASLGEMACLFGRQANKNPIPSGFIVLAGAFDQFLEETDLEVEIEAILKKVKADKIHSVDSASNKIRDLIYDAEFPKNIADEIIKEFKKLKAEYVAVRSSATAEDSSIASWAGELESYLNTNSKNLLDNVKKCWSSLFTPRAIFYRFEKGLDKRKVSVAVVVQKMIQSEISGITFTVHPVTEDRNQMVIEAGYGLGEAIVGGKITPDTYIINKSKVQKSKSLKAIEDKNISNQLMMIVRNNNGIKEIKVVKNLEERQKFPDKKIIELAKICISIEKHYKKPQDIEWAFEKGKIYIVQSRPITTL